MYLPLLFNTINMPCLVVGGGDVAERKVLLLMQYGCELTVIAPYITDILAEHFEKHAITWHKRIYHTGDCSGFHLVIAATSDRSVNLMVSNEAKSLGIPVNVVDVPELCSVIFPAIHNDGSLSIAVSTGGNAPFMAAEVRDRIIHLTPGWGYWVELAGSFRDIVMNEVDDIDDRRILYNEFISIGPIPMSIKPPQRHSLDDWLIWLKRLRENNQS